MLQLLLRASQFLEAHGRKLEQTERQNESLQVDTESEVSEQAEGLVKEQAEEHEVEVLNVALTNSQQTPVS